MKALRAVLAAVFVACCVLPAQADVTNITVSGSFTGTGRIAVPLNGQSYCEATLGGTGTGLAVTPQASGDSQTTWNTATNINAGSLTANGHFSGSIVNAGLTAFALNVTAITGGTETYVITCGGVPPSTVTSTPSGTQNVNSAQNTAGPVAPVACSKTTPINVSAASNVQLVALSGSTIVRVCAVFITVTGTNPILGLFSGTGAVCATGTTTLQGNMAPLSGSFLPMGTGLGTILQTLVGQALCLAVGGTTPSVQGWLLYEQF